MFFNLINFSKLCSLLAKFVNTQETFQCGLDVVVRVTWRRDIGQCKINVETTFCMSKLKFTMLSNVISTLSISKLILTKLDNTETMLLFLTSSFITLINVETACEYDHFQKVEKSKKIFLSFEKMMTHLLNNTCFWLWPINVK